MKTNKTMEIIYNEYIENLTNEKDALHNAWREISGQTEKRLSEGNLKASDLGTYEETVAHAAFYAGFKAAMEMMG